MNNPTVEEWLNQPDGLAERLRSARESKGMTGRQFAEATGWETSRVSRIENGKQTPTEADISTWAKLCGLNEAERQHLLGQLETLNEVRHDFRRRLKGGMVAIQAAHTKLAAKTTVTRVLETVVIPGLLQTADYYRHLTGAVERMHQPGAKDADKAVAERMRRQQYLYDTSKRFDFLIAEPALRWLYGPPEVMRAQLDRLQAFLDSLPNVRVGVIPLSARLPVPPMLGFTMYDDLVVTEDFIREVKYQADHAEKHGQLLDQLWEVAAVGGDARGLIHVAMDALPDG